MDDKAKKSQIGQLQERTVLDAELPEDENESCQLATDQQQMEYTDPTFGRGAIVYRDRSSC